jgi:hypothetical protein
MASVINHALAAIDQLAISHGEQIRSEDLLAQMAVSQPGPGEGERNEPGNSRQTSAVAQGPVPRPPNAQTRDITGLRGANRANRAPGHPKLMKRRMTAGPPGGQPEPGPGWALWHALDE